MTQSWAYVGALLIAGFVSACASVPGPPWQATLGHDHRLTGRIWDASASSFVDAGTFIRRVTQSDFVLLGEQHDNPDHHRLQAWVLRKLVAAGHAPAVGFEMFTADQQATISRHLREAPADIDGLAEAVNWDASGWPNWELYRPVVQAVFETGLPIVATNLPRASIQRLSRQGVAALDPPLVTRFGLDRPLAPETHRAMATEMREAHCGSAPQGMVEVMILVQRARDAHMADRLVIETREKGAVLIAGAGHTRTDRGIPTYLARTLPGAQVISLAFVEVAQGQTAPGAYAERFGQTALPFDYVWFTPRVDDLDPCEKFRHQLERLRKKR